MSKYSKLLSGLGTVFAMLAVTACSSQHSDLKDFMRCGVAANHLEQYEAFDAISAQMGEYVKTHNIDGSARDAALIRQEISDELALEGRSLGDAVMTLVEIYNSSTCQDMHGQGKIKL